jgi:homoserine O-acetyltransferase
MENKQTEQDRLNIFDDPSVSATASGQQRESAALVVEKKEFHCAWPPDEFVLESGERLGPITVAYETCGELNRAKNNAILICHALTGDSHAAGVYGPSDARLGWWDPLIGPGRPFDTDRYFVICSNVLGGCQGTTGPASINPATGHPYGSSFPTFTIRDQVRLQRLLVEHLGVEKLLAVAGGSTAGMQVLEWMVTYPEMVESAIPIACAVRLHPQAIAYNLVGRQAIMLDPHWHGGDYYDYGEGPDIGLAIARMVGMITYQSDTSMWMKFGRETTEEERRLLQGAGRFQVESYLHYQGDSLVERFDANSYLYLVRAMDLHDIGRGYGGWQDALRRVRARVLVMGIDSDILFPTYQQREMVRFLHNIGVDVSYFEIDSPYGHDAFLIEYEQMVPVVRGFVTYVEAARHGPKDLQLPRLRTLAGWREPGQAGQVPGVIGGAEIAAVPERFEDVQHNGYIRDKKLLFGQRSPGRF